MTPSNGSTHDAAARLIAHHRARLARLLQRPLEPPAPSGLEPDKREFLLEEAKELYWNELSWEQLTEEEGVGEKGLVEFTFPGFLAFIEGLLLREAMADSLAPASPRPEVVEDVLRFLAERCIALGAAADREERTERAVLQRLIDLVLYRQHDIAVEDVERAERVPGSEDA